MNKEEREQIISNNNIATDQLKSYLEGSTKPLNKIHIGYALFGDIDFTYPPNSALLIQGNSAQRKYYIYQ